MGAEANLAIYDRSAWGARPPSRPIRDIVYPVPVVYIHHEGGATFSSLDENVEKARMREVQNYTMDKRGYADIPYSIGAFPSGRMYEGRDLVDEEAATRHSGTSISIYCPGNYDRQAPTDAMLTGIALTIRLAIQFGNLTRTAQILGHRDNNPTGCPGNLLYAQLPEIRRRVLAAAPLPQPTPGPAPAPPSGGTSVDIHTSPTGVGYYVLKDDGSVYAYGDAHYHGGANGTPHAPMVDMAVKPDGSGYWLLALDGAVYAYPLGSPAYGGANDRPRFASSISATPDGLGYYILARDAAGTDFVGAYGSAQFLGRP